MEVEETEEGRGNILDDTEHPVGTVLTNFTIIESRSRSILVVNGSERLSHIDYIRISVYALTTCSSGRQGDGDIRFPESHAFGSVDLAQALVPLDKVAEC